MTQNESPLGESTSQRGVLIVISGPSGVGKTTLCDELLKRKEFTRVITCTTRAPRGEEKDGKDYLFLDKAEFEQGIAAGRFLEHANVHGKLYGTPRDQVEAGIRAGQKVLLNVDVQGAAQIRECEIPELVTIFIVPPSLEVLRTRLESRSTDTTEQIEGRMEVARREMEERAHYDHIVVNDKVDVALRELEDILF